jgi:methylated-DNA-[protein]-cysteine S-methyltransferase
VEAYLAGEREAFADVAVELRGISAWDRQVLAGVRRVPWGEVTSYGRLARIIGRPGAARAVGSAVGRNPIGLVVPCHRVIAGDGSLGGYGGAWYGEREALLEIKRRLLAAEGIELPVRAFVG